MSLFDVDSKLDFLRTFLEAMSLPSSRSRSFSVNVPLRKIGRNEVVKFLCCRFCDWLCSSSDREKLCAVISIYGYCSTNTNTKLGRDYVTMTTPAEILSLFVVRETSVVILRRSLTKFGYKLNQFAGPVFFEEKEVIVLESKE